jgi:hypothetical protein
MDCDSSESGRFRIGVRWIFQATSRIMPMAKAFSNSTDTWPPLRIQVGEDSPAPIQVSNRLMANRGPLSHRIRVKR